MKRKVKEATISEIQTQLRTFVEQLYAQSNVAYRPCFPFCLVRVLDRERVVGRIITPDKQRKTTIEGIVLDTFKPFDKLIKANGRKTYVRIESQLAPGDHILFAHFEGVPLPADDWVGHFRLVPEIFAYYGAERNGVIAKLEYPVDKTRVWLQRMILEVSKHEDLSTWVGAGNLADDLLANAELFPHNRQALTTSPRTGAEKVQD